MPRQSTFPAFQHRGITYKVCIECARYEEQGIADEYHNATPKPADQYFYKKKSGDGYSTYCKRCQLDKVKESQRRRYAGTRRPTVDEQIEGAYRTKVDGIMVLEAPTPEEIWARRTERLEAMQARGEAETPDEASRVTTKLTQIAQKVIEGKSFTSSELDLLREQGILRLTLVKPPTLEVNWPAQRRVQQEMGQPELPAYIPTTELPREPTYWDMETNVFAYWEWIPEEGTIVYTTNAPRWKHLDEYMEKCQANETWDFKLGQPMNTPLADLVDPTRQLGLFPTEDEAEAYYTEHPDHMREDDYQSPAEEREESFRMMDPNND